MLIFRVVAQHDAPVNFVAWNPMYKLVISSKPLHCSSCRLCALIGMVTSKLERLFSHIQEEFSAKSLGNVRAAVPPTVVLLRSCM